MVDLRKLGDPGNESFEVDKYPFYLLNRVVSRYNAVIAKELRKCELDIPFWRVLMVLGEHQPRSVGAISEATVINLSTMMRILQRMEAADLVTTAPRPDDNRVIEVFLSKLGARKLATARKLTAPIYQQAIHGFSEADFTLLKASLDSLYHNLTRSRERPRKSKKS